MEIKFVDGLFVNRRENAPDFVRASLSFQADKFIEWLKNNVNAKGYCNIDILMGNKGLYAKHNDWQPSKDESFVKTPEGKIKVVEHLSDEELFEAEEIEVDQIPF